MLRIRLYGCEIFLWSLVRRCCCGWLSISKDFESLQCYYDLLFEIIMNYLKDCGFQGINFILEQFLDYYRKEELIKIVT